MLSRRTCRRVKKAVELCHDCCKKPCRASLENKITTLVFEQSFKILLLKDLEGVSTPLRVPSNVDQGPALQGFRSPYFNESHVRLRQEARKFFAGETLEDIGGDGHGYVGVAQN